jgi:hypothetical protein
VSQSGLRHTPEKMTARARLYLLFTGLFELGIAYFAFAHPEQWRSHSYDALLLVFPLELWGGLVSVIGMLCLSAALLQHESFARVGAGLAALHAGAWASGFVAAWIIGVLQGPTGPLSWGLLTVFHLLQVAQPLRLPLEPILRRFADKE